MSLPSAALAATDPWTARPTPGPPTRESALPAPGPSLARHRSGSMEPAAAFRALRCRDGRINEMRCQTSLRKVSVVWCWVGFMDRPSDLPLEERDVGQTLDAVELWWLEALEGNCEIFLAAAHYADLCSGEGLPGRGIGAVLPGTERSVQLGGEGTPRVAEFAAAAFGARMRMGAVGGRAMIADALDARHRCRGCTPGWWRGRRGCRGCVMWRARPGSCPGGGAAGGRGAGRAGRRAGAVVTVLHELEGRIVAADPEAAARREEARRREVFAKVDRGSPSTGRRGSPAGPGRVGGPVRCDGGVLGAGVDRRWATPMRRTSVG